MNNELLNIAKNCIVDENIEANIKAIFDYAMTTEPRSSERATALWAYNRLRNAA